MRNSRFVAYAFIVILHHEIFSNTEIESRFVMDSILARRESRES